MKKPLFKNEKARMVACFSATAFLCVLMVFFLFNIGIVSNALKKFVSWFSPIIIGFVLAYVARPLCAFFEKRFFGLDAGYDKNDKYRFFLQLICVLLTFAIFAGVIVSFLLLLYPQIVRSYNDLITNADSYLRAAQNAVDSLIRHFPFLEDQFEFLVDILDNENVSDMVTQLIDHYFDMISRVGSKSIELAGKVVLTAYRTVIIVIVAGAVLFDRRDLKNAVKKIISGLFGQRIYGYVSDYAKLSDEKFGGFLVGKTLDSLIVGILSFVLFAIFRIPYYPLLALVIGFTNMIPYFGPFIGILIGGVFLIIPYPVKALVFVIITIVLQQLDGNFIGPKILGQSLDLRPLWVLLATTIMGERFGIVGMFIGAPVFSILRVVFNRILDYFTKKKEARKNTVAGNDGQEGLQ